MSELNPCPHCNELPIIEPAAALNGKYVLTHKCLDARFYIELSDEFSSPDEAAKNWNALQEKHHALQQVASNNADLFDNLVKDMAAILKCEPKPHIILAVMKNQNEFICQKCGLRQETGSENAAEATF